MKPAHVYLFTDHSRKWWRFRVFFPGGGHFEASGFRSGSRARDAAILSAKSLGITPVFKPTKSVPHPEAE